MRFFLLAALSALGLTVSATAASAGRGAVPVFVSEKLVYVAPTEIPGDNGQFMALCLLVEREVMVVLPTSFKAKKWVLSTDNCRGTGYIMFQPFGFELAKEQGLISAELPDKPTLSTLQWMTGAWGLLVIGAVILFGIGTAARNALFSRRRGKPSALALRALDALCHAAKADGRLTREEIVTIIGIIQRLTGQSLSTDAVKSLYDQAAIGLTPDAFAQFAVDVPFNQRPIIMEAVAMLLIADGEVPEEEQEFLAGLAYGLDLPPEEVERIILKYLPQNEPAGYGGAVPQPA